MLYDIIGNIIITDNGSFVGEYFGKFARKGAWTSWTLSKIVHLKIFQNYGYSKCIEYHNCMQNPKMVPIYTGEPSIRIAK